MADTETPEAETTVDDNVSADAETSDAAIETDTSSDPDSIHFDPNLLSLMVGDLGSPALIEEKCHQVALSLAQVFMVLFKDKNSLPIEATAGNVSQGTRSELLKAIEGDFCYSESKIETWSDDIALYCNNNLIIAIVECMLGGDDPDNIEPMSRTLSTLEIELSAVFFETLNEALKATITRNPTLEQSVDKPTQKLPDTQGETYQEYHAASFSLDLKFGQLETSATVIVPQSKIIKTDIEAVANRRRKAEKKTEWAEKLSKQVYNSDIMLQANIGLERLKLDEVSRLQVGDVLRFGEEGEPTVVLQANGRELYNCALGKSGNKYMIRVESPFGDEDWKDGI
ncbi:MAG: FliM/FliN family flagellar motor switch protein [Lentilitoribacter sp.]